MDREEGAAAVIGPIALIPDDPADQAHGDLAHVLGRGPSHGLGPDPSQGRVLVALGVPGGQDPGAAMKLAVGVQAALGEGPAILAVTRPGAPIRIQVLVQKSCLTTGMLVKKMPVASMKMRRCTSRFMALSLPMLMVSSIYRILS